MTDEPAPTAASATPETAPAPAAVPAPAGAASAEGGTPDAAALLAAYDAQLRIAGELNRAVDVVRHGPLHWARFDRGGFVTYENLGGATGAALDALIDATVAHFRDDTDVTEAEWKTRGHDQPADLGERLTARGFEPQEEESVMVGDARLLAVDVPLPDGITLRRAGDGGDLLDDARRALATAQTVFGGGSGPSPDRLTRDITDHPDEVELWMALAGDDVVCTGRLDRVPGTDFAGIWGGAALPQWRRRGIYRALTAARARSALRLGARYIHSDSSPMSRPILERSGLVRVTTTTPYVWTR